MGVMSSAPECAGAVTQRNWREGHTNLGRAAVYWGAVLSRILDKMLHVHISFDLHSNSTRKVLAPNYSWGSEKLGHKARVTQQTSDVSRFESREIGLWRAPTIHQEGPLPRGWAPMTMRWLYPLIPHTRKQLVPEAHQTQRINPKISTQPLAHTNLPPHLTGLWWGRVSIC